MIGQVRGRIIEVGPASITLDVGGIGLQLLVPERTAASAPEAGRELRLHTHLLVRENALELFGFDSADERAIFRAFLGVSGIGSRTALAILSRLTADEIVHALKSGDVDAFCRAPGVGRKKAQRLLVDLAERFDLRAAGAGVSGSQLAAAQDAIQALVTLGYTESAARKAVAEAQGKLDAGAEAGQIIRGALKALVGG